MDCKATVKIGEYSRGGKTRGENIAADHDMGCKEKYVPFGILDEDSSQLYVTFGSSAKTRALAVGDSLTDKDSTADFILDSLYAWWLGLSPVEQALVKHIQFKVDNGPESSGVRTQFLKRIVEFADHTAKTIQLLYYPPYHSKYNPVERTWGVMEQHWNGTLLVDVYTMLEWAKSMTWKGINPIVTLSQKVYQKGITLAQDAMQAVEARLQRNPLLPKWDIFIQPIISV